jgi:hypothetical protein
MCTKCAERHSIAREDDAGASGRHKWDRASCHVSCLRDEEDKTEKDLLYNVMHTITNG